jgi:phosphoesterase family protein
MVDYFSDVPQAGEFRATDSTHFKPIGDFIIDAAAGNLPQVALVDPLLAGETNLATDEHPPHDVRSGEYFISQIVSAVRSSPNWKDSILFITYDEHGGSYDHVAPPVAPQKGALNPDAENRVLSNLMRRKLMVDGMGYFARALDNPWCTLQLRRAFRTGGVSGSMPRNACCACVKERRKGLPRASQLRKVGVHDNFAVLTSPHKVSQY